MKLQNIIPVTTIFLFASFSNAGIIHLSEDYMYAESHLSVSGIVDSQSWDLFYSGNVEPYDISFTKSIDYIEYNGELILLGHPVCATNVFDGEKVTLSFGGHHVNQYNSYGIFWDFSTFNEMNRTFTVDGNDVEMTIYWDNYATTGYISIDLWDLTTETNIYSSYSNGFEHDYSFFALEDGHQYSLFAKSFVEGQSCSDPQNQFSITYKNADFLIEDVSENNFLVLFFTGITILATLYLVKRQGYLA